MFLVLYYINWPNFIAWLHLFLEILGNMYFAIVCFPVNNVVNFEINLIFLIKPTKKSRQKCKYHENEKSFKGEIKTIFYLV